MFATFANSKLYNIGRRSYSIKLFAEFFICRDRINMFDSAR